MHDVRVSLWVGDKSDVVEYVVTVEDGIRNTKTAIDEAIELAREDGYENLNLKEMEAV